MENHETSWNKVRENFESSIKEQDKVELGKYYSYTIRGDIKHLGFSFSRYKFASKLARFHNSFEVLELGCSEGLGAYFFSQMKNCKGYLGIDFDQEAIKTAQKSFSETDKIQYRCADLLHDNEFGTYDLIVSMDVIEHIEKEREKDFVDCAWKNLHRNGIAVIGTPNISMDPYASEGSKLGHVNLFDQKRLYETLSEKFHHVLIFNMNDENINTGFDPMSCYIIAVCCGKK